MSTRSCATVDKVFAVSSRAAIGGTFVVVSCETVGGVFAGSCVSVRMVGTIRRSKRAVSSIGERKGSARIDQGLGL